MHKPGAVANSVLTGEKNMPPSSYHDLKKNKEMTIKTYC